jgi:hypothetical protein
MMHYRALCASSNWGSINKHVHENENMQHMDLAILHILVLRALWKLHLTVHFGVQQKNSYLLYAWYAKLNASICRRIGINK